MSGSDFSRDWLRLRAGADLAARDPLLARRFAASLPRHESKPLRLADLAAGTGANARALLPRIAGDQDWLLIDRDRTLLAAQADEFTLWARRQGYGISAGGGQIRIDAGTARWQLDSMPLDLADLVSFDAIEADAITTSAFFDLVSREWLDRFVAWLAAEPRPLLAALSVDGRRNWQPPLPHDAIVTAAFARHQQGDKGFGPALGGTAPETLAPRLREAGFDIIRQSSDWRLGRGDGPLLGALVAGEAEAARQAAPGSVAEIAAWEAARRSLLADNRLELIIGHVDILALPRRPATS